MYLTILGRQSALSLAELEAVFGAELVTPICKNAALLNSDSFDINQLGGIPKAGKLILELSNGNWHGISQQIIKHYLNEWRNFDGKITLGISVYNLRVNPREIQKTGIILKQKLKQNNISLRLIPNKELSLNTAVSHHNKLGLSSNKVELIIVATDRKVYLAESTGAQNITAYAKRDRERPKRDAFVGMLPPKLAQTMINLAVRGHMTPSEVLLDPFCGTGVILQEAVLMGLNAYGTDLSDKMIDYSQQNLNWLDTIYHKKFNYKVAQGDAMNAKWQQPIDFVSCEAYLGQPFSAPPSPDKLREVSNNCNHIISEFLKNLSTQVDSGTTLCVAIPAWRDKNGRFAHLPLVKNIAKLGYTTHEFSHVTADELIYYREDQVVGRELLILTKI